jgi:N-acetylmuramoyl-L-alanine amidase
MTTRTQTNKIIWHCTATPEGREVTKEDLYRWHVVNNGWSDIGYHYLIQLDGTVVPCRPEHLVGAHVSGQNSDSIGISYSGGIMNDGSQRAKDTRTDAQIRSMYELTDQLLDKYDLDWSNVHGHNEYAAKACPSFDVQKDIKEKKNYFEDPDPDLPDLGPIGSVVTNLENRVKTLELRLLNIQDAWTWKDDLDD